MGKRKIEIEKIGSSIAIRVEQKNGSYSNNHYYPIINIRSVEHQIQMGFNPVQADNNRLMNYPYTDKLLISMNFVEGVAVLEYFDIQDVTNQPTWDNNPAGLTQALEDINGWLTEVTSGGPILKTIERIIVPPSTIGAIAPGYSSYSISNIGLTDALVDGLIFPSGHIETYDAGAINNTVTGFTYNSQLTTLIITTIL
jgi:hypothetical protein